MGVVLAVGSADASEYAFLQARDILAVLGVRGDCSIKEISLPYVYWVLQLRLVDHLRCRARKIYCILVRCSALRPGEVMCWEDLGTLADIVERCYRGQRRFLIGQFLGREERLHHCMSLALIRGAMY